jgi:hypothetical protein
MMSAWVDVVPLSTPMESLTVTGLDVPAKLAFCPAATRAYRFAAVRVIAMSSPRACRQLAAGKTGLLAGRVDAATDGRKTSLLFGRLM